MLTHPLDQLGTLLAFVPQSIVFVPTGTTAAFGRPSGRDSGACAVGARDGSSAKASPEGPYETSLDISGRVG